MMQPNEIQIKNTDVLEGLMRHNFHTVLIEIICAVAAKYGIFITESYRDPIHPGDVHSTDPVRAIDLRSWCYLSEEVAYQIRDWINENWQYDPSRPRFRVALIHNAGKGIHFHIQVHPHTCRRK